MTTELDLILDNIYSDGDTDMLEDKARPEFTADEILYYKGSWDDCEESYEIHYRIGNLYYVASDSHCSCNGFGPFDPTELTEQEYKAFRKRTGLDD